MKPAALGHLIMKSIESELSPESPIELVIDLPDDLPLVMLDADHMQQVIASLLINACEAMPHGGSLHVSAASVPLPSANDLGLTPGDYLHVIFEDSGIGILPENLPMIFDPYFTTKDMGCQKGMGLGLALSYSIIKHHQGQITAESEPGVGTRIHIYLPVCRS